MKRILEGAIGDNLCSLRRDAALRGELLTHPWSHQKEYVFLREKFDKFFFPSYCSCEKSNYDRISVTMAYAYWHGYSV